MSLHLPARRVATAAARATAGKPSLHLQYLQPKTQRRNAWFNWGAKPKVNSPLAQELSRREREQIIAEKNLQRTQGSSIFDEEIKDTERVQKQELEQELEQQPGQRRRPTASAGTKVKEHMERAENPDPRWRVRFLKKKVMQMVRNGDKPLTREQRVRLTEKQHTSASTDLPTSTKKLMFLSRQIAGKTVDEAITQMRFSKKKMAREVKWQLEEARDNAIVAHGMGLGAADGKTLEKPRKIQTKDGRWIEVNDPTTLYVDQSWVTKGPWRGVRVQYHARSRMSRMWRPTAAISLVLKEEKTRMRLYDEKVEKQARKRPWVHLPNRPVTAQRPYYSW
ncbi:ribosomal protein L22 [Daldinia loculata]|uniref:ribosomal protein L22 n=1 Tax=Daldinia loculata TaxID=103429 RepID=UPI0020C20447|nr:ribosomal protein L22 [Daldinia loculata]KAI1642793.1 ribosomal protein L22 [Daldinia loculata]